MTVSNASSSPASAAVTMMRSAESIAVVSRGGTSDAAGEEVSAGVVTRAMLERL